MKRLLIIPCSSCNLQNSQLTSIAWAAQSSLRTEQSKTEHNLLRNKLVTCTYSTVYQIRMLIRKLNSHSHSHSSKKVVGVCPGSTRRQNRALVYFGGSVAIMVALLTCCEALVVGPNTKSMPAKTNVDGNANVILPPSLSPSPADITDHYIDTYLSSPPATPQELREMALKNARRTVGSTKYIRSWRHWTDRCLASIRYHLGQNLDTPPDMEAFRSLWLNLGVAADTGDMPSFEDAGSRSGYALDFFCRARLFGDLMKDLDDNPFCPMELPNSNLFQSPATKVLSIGGGPGYDVIAAALIATFHGAASSTSSTVTGIVYDYEEGWQEAVEAMNKAMQITFPDDNHSLTWGGRCDITKSLSDPVNALMQQQVSTSDLICCQYCVAENANSLVSSNLVFFRELLQQSNDNAIILLTETTPRVWPDLVDAFSDANIPFEVCFVRNLGRGKGGPQFLVRKSASDISKVWQPDMLDQFRTVKAAQERKMNANYERQRRKIRGAKEEV
jgi:hypothetical protein